VRPLVSIIIPCYNAERWIREALESCLAQTYRPIEIIVVDDGSTDNSLARVPRGERSIRVATGPHRGAGAARNRGFALSSGEYIQFLDADDLLYPQKIERQVQFLEESGADVVYGDWQFQTHRRDGSVQLSEPLRPGARKEVLEGLLGTWWVAQLALLLKRHSVMALGGWDEKLPAAQDRDFFSSVAFTGAVIRYQPGCHSVYRRYGNVTVSTSDPFVYVRGHCSVLDKCHQRLVKDRRLSLPYRKALASGYFGVIRARSIYDHDRLLYRDLIARVRSLDPRFKVRQGPPWFQKTAAWMGMERAEQIYSWRRSVGGFLRRWKLRREMEH